jgi:hypothetical protein
MVTSTLMLLWCLALNLHAYGPLMAQALVSQRSTASLHDIDADESDDDEHYQEALDLAGRPYDLSTTCEGCNFAIDLSCSTHWSRRSGYFHRLADCLLPSYGLLEWARSAVSSLNGTVCILTYSRKPNMEPFLPVLIPDILEHARVVDFTAPCAASLTPHAVNPSPFRDRERYGPYAEQSYLDNFPTLRNITGRHPIDWAANLRALHRDVADAASPFAEPQLLLLDRPFSFSRILHPKTFTAVSDMLKGIAGAKNFGVRDYSGSESIVRTFSLFMSAAGTIGYHGAAFVNALFTTRPSCVMEVTTYIDDANLIEWRTNEHLAHENSFLSWHKVHIKLQTLLDINNVTRIPWFRPPGKRNKLSKWIKHLRYVQLLDSDMVVLQASLENCLRGQ